MDWVLSFFAEIGSQLKPYSSNIALALVASLLVITGGDINRFIKKQFQTAHFLFRTLVFILVSTFGYGALTVLLTSVVKTQLAALKPSIFAMVVISAFLALGIYAERKKQI